MALLYIQSLYYSDFLPGNFYRVGASLDFWRLFQTDGRNLGKVPAFLFQKLAAKASKDSSEHLHLQLLQQEITQRYINVVIEARKLWNSQRKTCMLLKTINRMFLSCKIHRAGVQCSPTAVRSFFIGIKGECASFSSSSSLVQKLRKF